MAYDGDPLFLIGRSHSKVSQGPRAMARWSAGAVVATWGLRDITIAHSGAGLFASLNADARTGLACLAQVPVIFPLILFVFALQMIYGSFYTSVRKTLLGSEHQFRISTERGILVNRLMGGLPLAWRRWLVFGWWLIAGLSGAVTVAITGALLRTAWNTWLVWALVVVAGWCLAKLEDVLTERRYRVVIPLRGPDRQEALRRAREWREQRPADTSGMPWIYAYSGLSDEEMREEFLKLGSSGPLGFTAKVWGCVIVALLYSVLPAPDVSRFQSQGLTGCFFSIVHDFAGVARENLMPSIIAGVVLLVLMPISILLAYLRFMIRYRFPPQAVAHVLVGEMLAALFMPLYMIVMAAGMALAIALLMWVSAVVADRWNSPIAGTVVLGLPIAIIVWAIRRTKVRGPVPR
jgi:hypothetical protein